jgi:hypothetical protein
MNKVSRLKNLRLAAVAAGLLALSFGHAIAQTAQSYSGILSVMWGDPKPGAASGGAMLFELTLPDGSTHPLQIDPARANVAVQFFGKHVTVMGRVSNAAATTGPSTIVVDDIKSAEPANSATEQPRAKVTRKVLFVLLKFQGDAQLTHPVSFYTNELTNPQNPPAGSLTPASINGFFKKTSWGKLQWHADVVGVEGLNPTHWFTLPMTKTSYANCGWPSVCANLTQLRNDALALVTGAGVDYTVYDNINFVINNDLDCCAWGGSFSDGSKSYGQTFEPPWSQEAGTYVHEMGHSVGLPHSGWRYYAYDSHHDQMSRGNPALTVSCGSYNSANDGGMRNIDCTEPGAGYIAVHKDYLHWIPSANKATLNKVATKTYVIEAQALPLGSRLKMVKICIAGEPCTGAEGTNAHFLTVEAKMKVAKYENGLPSGGIVIHDVLMNRRNTISGPCFFNNQNGWAIPIDATPGDFTGSPTCGPQDQAGHGLMNMPFVVGKKYSDPTLHVTVKVMSKTATTMTVKVTRTQ